jgi:signal recognition particle subunit SEC65
MLSRLKDAAILRNKARLAGSLLEVLRLKYNKDVIDVLRKLGYRMAFDPKNPEQYFKDLDRVASETVRQTNLVKEIEGEYRRSEKNKAKAEDFDKILAHLGKFQGYRLDPDKVTVSEFVEIMTLYKEANKK